MSQEPTPPQPAHDIELPMSFYLGREYDLKGKRILDEPLMYDAKDLTTHGVVVGMTGSGKTGLCIGLLEEAAIDGIPSIIIDPKGDLTNLLLQFPDLDPKDFQKWINPGEAKQKKMTPEEYAEKLSGVWHKGLEDTYQPLERISLLKDSSEWRIYTPGSEAGLPLSVLKNFAAPEGNILREHLNQRIDATATALLGLTGTVSDPVQSREHILIAQLLLHAWSRGKSLDLPELIAQIQYPPLNKIGAFDVDTFYPEKDRLKLAVALNNILAAPSFSTWIEGEGLDLSAMMFTPEGKPRQLIFYIAHLEESQRLFFVTLLLEEVLNWTRKQPGTTTLRALLYFDEVFGYLPPHPANPPTKLPLMTMLKQARAFGVGVLLATQNPVDIDYKALSNAGTWFVGKLQTERDKDRLIEGLEGVAAEQGSLTNRKYLETVISSLGNRVFLYHNVHRGQPKLFKTRHTLTFLRGPMTRDQVATLMKPVKDKIAAGDDDAAPHDVEPAGAGVSECIQCRAETQAEWKYCPMCGTTLAATASRMADEEFKHQIQATKRSKKDPSLLEAPPPVPSEVAQHYLPLASPARPVGAELVYRGYVLALASVIFSDRKRDLYHSQQYHLLTDAPEPGQPPAWHTGERLKNVADGVAVDDAFWEAVPKALQSGRYVRMLDNGLVDYLYGDARLKLYQNSKLDLVSEPGEDVLDFQARCRREATKQMDEEIEEEKRRYRPKFAALGSRLPEGASGSYSDSGIADMLKTVAWMALGKRRTSSYERIDKLRNEWFAKQAAIIDRWRDISDNADDVLIKPLKKNIQVVDVGLAWAPFWQLESNAGAERVAAYR